MTEVVTPLRNSLISQPIIAPTLIPGSSTTVGASIISNHNTPVLPVPVAPVVTIDPTTRLSPKVLVVIQKLSNINPLRGSVVNRLDAPQYVS